MVKEETIKVSPDKRILIKRKWHNEKWKYFVYTQQKTFFWWISSGWGSDDLFIFVRCFDSLDEARDRAEMLRRSYLQVNEV